MDMKEISKLASILRENGDKVLNGSSKLTLSATLLNNINNSFALVTDQRDSINSSFHVINTSSTQMDAYRDLQFLHDFFQRSISLKLITSKCEQEPESVDINKFKNLKLFEVEKCAIASIFGLKNLRNQIQFIKCFKSLNNLGDVLENCGGDSTTSDVNKVSGVSANASVNANVSASVNPSISANVNASVHTNASVNPSISANESASVNTNASVNPSISANESASVNTNASVNPSISANESASVNTNASVNPSISANVNASDLIWGELKEAIFNRNSLTQIDTSFAFTPNLHTLDLSHNCIQDATALNCLIHLKHLNLGYNKLKNVPLFVGQVCNRLQVLVLRNNLIEDVCELSGLYNLVGLDLSENCLIAHNALAPLANLATLQWLSLFGNPLGYHPQHRSRTLNCLHANTGTVRFVLDLVALSSNEKKLVGFIHPRVLKNLVTKRDSSAVMLPEKPRRFRNALIANTDAPEIINPSLTSACALLVSGEHLETKRQIEQLRGLYGEKWLHSQGGSLVQDALGLARTPIPLSSTPYEADILIHAEIHQSRHETECDESSRYITTTTDITPNDDSLYANVEASADAISEDEDVNEENLYLVTIRGEAEPVFVAITQTHIIERECTSKERTRWPLETLLAYESIDSDPPYVQLHFDTVKNDRKQRQYNFNDLEESTRFKSVVRLIIDKRPPEESQFDLFKCMKCSTQFGFEKNKRLHEAQAIQCPACKSSMVFEDDG